MSGANPSPGEPRIEAFEPAPLARPSVARPRGGSAWMGYGVVVAIGCGVLFGMSARRTGATDAGFATPAAAATITTPPQPLADDAPSIAPASASASPLADAGSAVPARAVLSPFSDDERDAPIAGAAAMPLSSMSSMPRTDGSGTPAVVVDLGTSSPDGTAPLAPGAAASPIFPNPGEKAGDEDRGNTAGFAGPVALGPATIVQATRLARPAATVAEGTVIGATLETAINSDLSGMVRAVIARDVASFDGSTVLIPRGSKVVGQYKPGVAQGQSRVFVIWTRLIRPDGASVQLVSPGGDDLGRGGLGGKVDRHFLERFGGSLLLSVVNGAINAGVASLGAGIPVYVNSVAEAGAAATSAGRNHDIPPTIRTKQGTSVKIFVARDLDFSAVGPGR